MREVIAAQHATRPAIGIFGRAVVTTAFSGSDWRGICYSAACGALCSRSCAATSRFAIAELQACIRPDLHDPIKLLERDRIDLSPNLIDRAAAGVTPLAALDEFARFRDALPGLGENVDQPSVFHLFGCIDAAADHHFFSEGRADSARHQAVGAHAGEQTEDVFREAKLRPTLRDNDVERKKGLEAAAERITLRQDQSSASEDRGN